MFCRKCGSEIQNTERFCPMCGTEVSVNQTQSPQNSSVYQAAEDVNTSQSEKKFPVLAVSALAGGAVLLIAFIILMASLVFSKGYEKPIETMMKAVQKQDANRILSVFPDGVYEYLEEEEDKDYKEFKEDIEDVLADIEDMYLDDIKIKYEILDASDMRNRHIRDIEDRYDGYFEIKKGKVVEVDMDVYVDGKREMSETFEINVIKVKGKWYLDPYSTPF